MTIPYLDERRLRAIVFGGDEFSNERDYGEDLIAHDEEEFDYLNADGGGAQIGCYGEDYDCVDEFTPQDTEIIESYHEKWLDDPSDPEELFQKMMTELEESRKADEGCGQRFSNKSQEEINEDRRSIPRTTEVYGIIDEEGKSVASGGQKKRLIFDTGFIANAESTSIHVYHIDYNKYFFGELYRYLNKNSDIENCELKDVEALFVTNTLFGGNFQYSESIIAYLNESISVYDTKETVSGKDSCYALKTKGLMGMERSISSDAIRGVLTLAYDPLIKAGESILRHENLVLACKSRRKGVLLQTFLGGLKAERNNVEAKVLSLLDKLQETHHKRSPFNLTKNKESVGGSTYPLSYFSKNNKKSGPVAPFNAYAFFIFLKEYKEFSLPVDAFLDVEVESQLEPCLKRLLRFYHGGLFNKSNSLSLFEKKVHLAEASKFFWTYDEKGERKKAIRLTGKITCQFIDFNKSKKGINYIEDALAEMKYVMPEAFDFFNKNVDYFKKQNITALDLYFNYIAIPNGAKMAHVQNRISAFKKGLKDSEKTVLSNYLRALPQSLNNITAFHGNLSGNTAKKLNDLVNALSNFVKAYDKQARQSQKNKGRFSKSLSMNDAKELNNFVKILPNIVQILSLNYNFCSKTSSFSITMNFKSYYRNIVTRCFYKLQDELLG